MPSLQTHNNSGRKKLIVTKAPEAKQITGKDNKPLDFIEFMAKVEGEDSAVKYSVWSKTFNEFFKLDAVVDCDIIVTDQKQKDPDGNFYKNRKITQVYQDGKPVKEQQQKQWGKSPETVAMEVESKARNESLMATIDMIEAKEIEFKDWRYYATQFYRYLKGESDVSGLGKEAPEKPAVRPPPKETVQPAQEKHTLNLTESEAGIVAEISKLLDAISWKPVTWRSWIKGQFKVDSTGELAVVLSRLNPNQVNMLTNHLKAMKEVSGK